MRPTTFTARPITKRISPAAKSVEVMYSYMKALPNWLAMRDETVYPGAKRAVVRLNVFPITRETATVSPTALPKARIVPETIAGFM